MSMSAEQIIDRRRIRRKLAFWRITGVVALVAAAIGLIVSVVGRDAFPSLAEDQIARISISGFPHKIQTHHFPVIHRTATPPPFAITGGRGRKYPE